MKEQPSFWGFNFFIFYVGLSTSVAKPQGQAVSSSVAEMVQMTVQSYRRSLQEFSESPLTLRCKSLDSSHSLAGAPQSITEWLALWERDPVEILLDLGFGTEEPDVCTKIPPRFLSGASVAKGINIRVFLEAQKQRMDIERPNLYERFLQLEVLDHVTSALSSLLTDVNTQPTKSQDADRNDADLLDAAESRPAVTREKWRRLGQLLKRASKQMTLLKRSSPTPGEVNSSGKKEQPRSYIDEGGTVQVGFSSCVTFGCLTQEQTPRDKGALADPTSQCSRTPSGKTWASAGKQPHLSPVCEIPDKNRPRKEAPLLVTHALKKVADLHCKLPESFEMEEIQTFEDETPFGNVPVTTSAEMVVTRTSSCQSDSSGLMEELPEPVVLQNASLSEKINLILDIHNEETILPRRMEFPMLNQDFQQKPDDCVAKVFFTASKSIFTVPGSTEAGSDQGEETHPLLTAENGEYEACNTEPHSSVQEMLCAMGRKEEKTGRKQLENEECTKEHSPCRSDAREEGDPSSSKFDQRLYFRTEHKKVNVSVTELIDINPEVISESKIRGEDEGERCLTEKYIGAACHERAHEGRTEQIKGAWWDGEVASRDDTLLAANGVTNGRKFYKTDGDSKSTRCSSKTGLPGMRGSSPTHLTKSVSLDTVFCGKYRSHYWAEASGTRIVQRNHCCHCCPWTFPSAASPQCSMGCCSKCAATELRLLETPMLLQDTAMQNLAPCTLHEIEVMKSSCQRFQEKLDEIEQHLIEQQVLFSNAMPDEGREEDRYLQLLRRAVRQEVAELEFWLNDQACHVGKNVLMQLDQLLVEQSHLFSELGLSDGKGERKAQNKQALPDATDVVRPQSGYSELVLQRSPSKNNTATGSLSSLQSGPSPMPFPTRATREPNSAESYSQKLSITKKEIKGPPQAKMDFKAFLHNLKNSF